MIFPGSELFLGVKVKLPRPRSAARRRPESAPRRVVEWRAPPQEVPKEVLSKVLSLAPWPFSI